MRAAWTTEQRDQLLRADENTSEALVAAAKRRDGDAVLDVLPAVPDPEPLPVLRPGCAKRGGVASCSWFMNCKLSDGCASV